MTNFGVKSSLRSPAARRIEERAKELARLRGEKPDQEIRRPVGPVVSAPPPKQAKKEKPPLPPPFVAPIAPKENAEVNPGLCRRIIAETAEKFEILPQDIVGDSRGHKIVTARHEAIYRCVVETQLSLPALGRIFRRDHTSIGYAAQRHHLLTGAPAPRGMTWASAKRKRHGVEP